MIVCCGEALIDMLPRRTESGEACLLPLAGGSVFNTAVALGRLGAPVEFLSGLSTDLFGSQLTDALAASGAGISYVRISDRPTTLAFVQLVDGQASYIFYDENTAGRMLSEQDLPELGNDVDALLFGGISLIAEPCGGTYEALARREQGGRVIMLDPNIRPAFIPDRAAHLARMLRMSAMADIIKLSEDDLAWFGDRGSDDELAATWLAAGPQLVLVTRGSRGATAYTRQLKVTVAPPPVSVVDTVGAGDTFNAGLLASLHEQGVLSKTGLVALSQAQLRQAVELGTRSAAVTVSRAGANPPWRDELG